MALSFFTLFSLLMCVHSALIPPSLIGRDSPTSVATAISLPTCAIACIEQAVTTETNCAASDLVCQCNPDNASLIQGEATSCILDACGIDEAFQVLDDATEQCSSILASTGGSGGSIAAPSSAAASSAIPSSPASASAVPSSLSTTSPLDSSPSSVVPSSAASSIASALPSSNPNTPLNSTYIIPACAIPCIQNAIAITSCAITDLRCQCDPHNSGAIQSATANCVIASCRDTGDAAAVEIQKGQAANCTVLIKPPGTAIASGPASGPTQISLTGFPSGIPSETPACGNPYRSPPSGSNTTDPSSSSPTSGGGDPPPTTTDPSLPSSTNASADPSGSSGSSSIDPTSTSSSTVPDSSDGSFPSSAASNPTIPSDPTPSVPGTGDGSFPSSNPTDPPAPGGNGGGGGTPSYGYGYGYGGYYPSAPRTPTPTPSGSDPSVTSGIVSASSSAKGPVSSSGSVSSTSLISSGVLPSTSGGNGDPSSPGTSGGGSFPSTTGGSSPSTTGIDPSSPGTTRGGSLPSRSGEDSSSPSTTGSDFSSPSTSGSDSSSPSESLPSLPSLPSSSSAYPSRPSLPPGYYGHGYGPAPLLSLSASSSASPVPASFTSPSDPSTPSPFSSSLPSSPSSSLPSSPSSSPSSPSSLSSPSTPSSSSSPDFRLTLLPKRYTLLTYIMRVYFGRSPPSPYISSSGLTTSSREEACIFRVEAGGLLSCDSSSSSTSTSSGSTTRDLASGVSGTHYFGDSFITVQRIGYTVLAAKNSLGDLETKGLDLNGSYVVDTTSEYPYGSLLRMVNGGFVGNENQARFCIATTPTIQSPPASNPSSDHPTTPPFTYSNSGSQFKRRPRNEPSSLPPDAPVRAYINGTQPLPADCEEVRLVIEWVDDEGAGETPGYT